MLKPNHTLKTGNHDSEVQTLLLPRCARLKVSGIGSDAQVYLTAHRCRLLANRLEALATTLEVRGVVC